MFTIGLSADVLAGLAGMVISLACSYVPGIAPLWGTLDGAWKRLVMAVMLIVVSIVIVVLACAGVLQGVECSRNGVWAVLSALFSALVVNQSVYAITAKSDKIPVRVIGEVS
jgi:phosphoglycerol transferase MdoB-like AlkP superfamily enzyme